MISILHKFGTGTNATRNTIIVLAAGLALNAFLIFYVILPVRRNLKAVSEVCDGQSRQNDMMRKTIRLKDDTQSSIAKLRETLRQQRDELVLKPLLNSYSMQAQSILKPYASRYGLTLQSVKKLQPIQLQQPEPLGDASAYMRQPIAFSTTGSYTQLVSFISQVEHNVPKTTLSSLKIASQNRDPENHAVTVCFEWLIPSDKTGAEK